MPWWRTEGTCHYPSLGGGGLMRVTGIEEIETYISMRQNTVAQYIATCPIL